MNFDKLFKILSYAAVFCGFFSLWVSGTFGLAGTLMFLAVMVVAWLLEGSRWQISERWGTALIVLAMPLYYLLWRYRFFDFANPDAVVGGILARLILSLSAIKLLQKKSDRDWIFLYIMSFFEVLLAAGLSISLLYLVSFVGYAFVMVCTIILFEIKKTDKATNDNASVVQETTIIPRLRFFPFKRLPATAIILILLILAIATPMFFMLPRVGGAGIGANPGGVSTATGFSDTVTLGGIGRIQQNDEVVMRVRLENRGEADSSLRWRGLALDTFDNKSWSKTRAASRETRVRGDRDVIQVDYATGRDSLTIHTVYLEPLDTPILFVLPRAVGIQGNFQSISKDPHGSLYFQRPRERISYKVLSDASLPSAALLREDNEAYTNQESNYLQLPYQYDKRIAGLAERITQSTNNRYDAARAIESYLQNEFGYTLEQKAGGSEPLANFLFDIREGHCEYFSSAMAVMLRTRGIATRVVNGFQQGEYNETADVYVVRAKNAHSWVEVYFPGENAWVPFDPTPYAGQNLTDSSIGFTAQVGKYLEALEMLWIQYFVAFDNQEQRSLFTSVKRSFSEYQSKTSTFIGDAREGLADWWRQVRGDRGIEASISAIGYGALYLVAAFSGILVFVWLYRKVVKWKVWQRLKERFFSKQRASIVEFYERMQRILASKGLLRQSHQTPLEFAFALNMPEAVMITEKYNRVRFGEKNLSNDEAEEIESWLGSLENKGTSR